MHTLTNQNKLKGKQFDSIVIVGMGGSGLTGNVMEFIKNDIGLSVPVYTSKDFELPVIYTKNPLFLFSSFSGNTRETIISLQKAIKEKKRVAIVTSGGKIEHIAKTHNLPLGVFKTHGLTPREGLIYNLNTIVSLLSVCFPLKNKELHTVQDSILVTRGKEIAKKIGARIPLIYTTPSWIALGIIWKIFFNESAKIPAFSNTIPEIAHNEIEAIVRSPKFFIPVFLVSKKMNKENEKKVSTLISFFKSKNIPTISIYISGTTHKEIFLNAFALALNTTTNIAKKNGVSPHHTPFIDNFKEKFEQ